MRKIFNITITISLLLGGLLTTATAQNLVPNPSFEDTVKCPETDGQVSFAEGWYNVGADGDYFHSCSNNFSVPYNWGGYQPVAKGEAYCALGTYGDFTKNIRDLIQIQLNTSLTIGKKYYLSFKISLSISDSIFANCATNKVGALFTTYSYDYDFTSELLPDFAHVYTDNIITDTANWVKVQGSFVADSAYQYITLGNFFSDSLTDTLIIVNDTNYIFSYYFIDDVCVSEDSFECLTLSNSIYNLDKQKQIVLYPNPTTGIFYLSRNVSVEQVKVFDASGQLVPFYLNKQNTINISHLSAGLYFIQLQTKDLISTKKIILY